MTNKISKSNDDLAFFNDRINEMNITSYERHLAKAHLARAQAFADFLAMAGRAVGRVFRQVTAKPTRHPAHFAG